MGVLGNMVNSVGGRGGFALAAVLLAVLLLTALALMAAAASRAQLKNAGASLRLLSARAAAEAAVESRIGQVSGLAPGLPGSVSIGPSGLIGPLAWEFSDYRIDPEFHAFVGEAPVVGTSSFVRAARIVWWLDPVSTASRFAATIESGGVVVAADGAVSGANPLAPFGVHAGCGGDPALAAAFPGPIPDTGPLPGAPAWGGGSSAAPGDLRIGWYDGEQLARIADVVLPAASVLTLCPACWQGLLVAPEDALVSGIGAGVLVARADLTLGPAAAWTGLIVSEGDLSILPGAQVTGLIRSGGAVSIADLATVQGSACAAYRSLLAAETLLRPIRVPGPTRLGPLPPY